MWEKIWRLKNATKHEKERPKKSSESKNSCAILEIGTFPMKQRLFSNGHTLKSVDMSRRFCCFDRLTSKITNFLEKNGKNGISPILMASTFWCHQSRGIYASKLNQGLDLTLSSSGFLEFKKPERLLH